MRPLGVTQLAREIDLSKAVVHRILQSLASRSLRSFAETLERLASVVFLLLLGGFVIPLSELPGPLRRFAEALPSSALVDLVRAGFGGTTGPGRAWVVLALWAVAMPLVAAKTFRWSPAR